jgi:hypothetical protein
MPTERPSPGCVLCRLPDGRKYEVDLNDTYHGDTILNKAAELAWDRGGGTNPISDYDIRIAREIISGEQDEIVSLRRQLFEAKKEIAALKAKEQNDG